MRIVIRLFFRTLRLALTPVMLISERFSTPKAVERSDVDQAKIDQESQKLALYQFAACPFCIKVRKEMARLGLTVEKRDAQHNPEHRTALQADGGKVKVPCLLIEDADGNAQWLYESDAINAWLKAQFEPAAAA